MNLEIKFVAKFFIEIKHILFYILSESFFKLTQYQFIVDHKKLSQVRFFTLVKAKRIDKVRKHSLVYPKLSDKGQLSQVVFCWCIVIGDLKTISFCCTFSKSGKRYSFPLAVCLYSMCKCILNNLNHQSELSNGFNHHISK